MKPMEEKDVISAMKDASVAEAAEDFPRFWRRFSRTPIEVPARIEIHSLAGGRFTSGFATVRDISLKGARLGDIDLEGKFLPCAPFRIHLTLPSTVCPGTRAICRPVRFGTGDAFEIAVEFEDFQPLTSRS
ncbi:MAG: PilZ domain-containing protein [Planctomycetes bacterium]|nr:PilZ domain-containing protein [Planctomycetota bacterium]